MSQTPEDNVAQLIGWLHRLNLFVYQKYLQRLTSRFDFDPDNVHSERSQKHQSFLCHFPLFGTSREIPLRRKMLVGEFLEKVCLLASLPITFLSSQPSHPLVLDTLRIKAVKNSLIMPRR